MTWPRLWPRSLSGQLAALVAIALFLAQAINFALLFQGGRNLRRAEIIGPAVTRLVSAVELDRTGAFAGRSKWIDIEFAPPPILGQRQPEIEALIASALTDAGQGTPNHFAFVRSIGPDDLENPRAPGARRILRSGGQLVMAVEVDAGRWVVLRGPWPTFDWHLVWRLIGHSVIIYLMVIAAVLWIGRRISRPLADLREATHGFSPADPGAPVIEQGPADVRDLIAAFNGLRMRVAAMLQEKDRMLGAIGHDLRTPLAALRVRIESVDDDSDRARMAETIDGMSRTLDDILSLARIGRGSEVSTETDLAALVEVVVDDFIDLDQPVTLIPSSRIVRRVRPAGMQRAVRNLIENALKYAGAADVSVIERDGAAIIAVADRGPGIPVDRMDDVFEPFTRLEASRNRETGGSGLGLALARAIVQDAGGLLVLANREGGGLSAEIRLPR